MVFLSDTVMTFFDEVQTIWRRRWTVVTWVYLFIRYLGAVVSIVQLIPVNSDKVRTLLINLLSDTLMLHAMCFPEVWLYMPAL